MNINIIKGIAEITELLAIVPWYLCMVKDTPLL